VFGYRFVVLDGYDISMLGWPPDHPNSLVAEAILNKHNPNQNQNSPKNLKGPSRYA
jgi:manganese-dependent ADP-ribose/CDP-alcohol diphosphatase